MTYALRTMLTILAMSFAPVSVVAALVGRPLSYVVAMSLASVTFAVLTLGHRDD